MKELAWSQFWWQCLIMVAVGYLIGCFNFARVISGAKKRDITKIGSGNPGTMNMTREFGVKIGLLTFFCDAFKGGIPATIGFFIYKDFVFAGTQTLVSDFVRYLVGVSVIIGHIFPVTMHFKGGKGIASTLGLFWLCLACENAWLLPIGFGFLLFVAFYIVFTEWGSMGSLIGVSGFTVWQGIIFFLRYQETLSSWIVVSIFMMLLAINLLTWIAHKKNIMRLLSGEEHRTSVKKMLKKKKKSV